jgi:putative phosphoribosyl transferase
MFLDRADAGRRLAARLAHVAAEPRLVVLGLPRGGVVVAAEVAAALHAPLDVLVVRKIGAPWQPELALGAVTNGEHPQRVLNEQIIAAIGPPPGFIDAEAARQLTEVRRRQSLYRGGQPGVPVEGRAVIVVDDGVATGATVRAGLRAIRSRKPDRLILAVPVAPLSIVQELQTEVDELICLHAPLDFHAVGMFYEHFDQTSDAEVVRLLREAAAVQK